MKLELSLRVFKKFSNIKFHENPSNGSRVVACRRTDRWTDVTKLIVTFCNFANVPKNPSITTKEFLLLIYQGFVWVVYI